MNSILEGVIGVFLVLVVLLVLYAGRNAIKKFAPKSRMSEKAIKLIDELYKTIDDELKLAMNDNTLDGNDIALKVFLNVKEIYRNRLEEIAEAMLIGLDVPQAIGATVQRIIGDDHDGINDRIDRIIFNIIEDKISESTK